MGFNSTYLYDIFNSPADYTRLLNDVSKKVRQIQRTKLCFDAIAFRGVSGAALAFPLSIRLGIPLICSRKENCHSSLNVEGPRQNIDKYLIIDDVTASGNTICKIIESVKLYEPNAECVGILLYKEHTRSANFTKFEYKGKEIKGYTL